MTRFPRPLEVCWNRSRWNYFFFDVLIPRSRKFSASIPGFLMTDSPAFAGRTGETRQFVTVRAGESVPIGWGSSPAGPEGARAGRRGPPRRSTVTSRSGPAPAQSAQGGGGPRLILLLCSITPQDRLPCAPAAFRRWFHRAAPRVPGFEGAIHLPSSGKSLQPLRPKSFSASAGPLMPAVHSALRPVRRSELSMPEVVLCPKKKMPCVSPIWV